MTDKLRVGVVGGGIGHQHITAYKTLPDQYDVLAICDLNLELAQELATEYAIPRVNTDLDELCQMADLDVIDICTPSFLHFPQVMQVVEAGKHAFGQKPIAGSLREIDELIAAEARTGKRIMPMYALRFGHGVQKLKLLADAGVTGEAYLTTMETAWRREADYYALPWRGKWETELGGPIVTLAIHAHDILTYVLGPVKRVFARTATRVNPVETEDCVTASLEMADGSLASLSVTTGSAKQISRYRFCFSGLTAESNQTAYTPTHDPWTFTGYTTESDAQIEQTLADFDALPENFAGQFYRFDQALHNETELPVTLQDARASIELITALYYSAETGLLVQLPIGPDHPRYVGWQPTLTAKNP